MKDTSSWNYGNTVPAVNLQDPDEMIRANGAAEAARTDRLLEEVEDYGKVIEELRALHDRNSELVQKLQFMNRTASDEFRGLLEDNNRRIAEKLDALQDWDREAFAAQMKGTVTDSRDRILNTLKEERERADLRQQQSDEFSHRENVRVYRNVQASMIQELSAQTQQLNERLDAIAQAQKQDESHALIQKISFGMVIAVLVIQVLEGMGLIAMLMSVMR
ncbi:MAG: hypothetical protein IJG52_06530 [Lachnospiraceae bacterium]|nr:hypothetical protein [Lachnospiraceae bacterium]